MPSTIETIPADRARAHLTMLNESGKTDNRIARESGVAASTVRRIRIGTQPTTTEDTESFLLGVKPHTGPARHFDSTVSSVEGIRILRGLFAQGWSWAHIGDLLGGLTGDAAFYWAHHTGDWMKRDTLVRIRAVARELGPFDIRELTVPMPGMSQRSASCAQHRGWVAYKRWNARTIADPEAAPDPVPVPAREAPPAPAEDPAPMPATTDGERYAYIDPILSRRIARTAQAILEADEEDGRKAIIYVEPLGRLTKLEMHAAWWIGDEGGLNDTQIGQLLGYPARSMKERDTAQRQMNRIRLRVLAARAWAESHPHGWIPDWFNWRHLNAKRNLPGMLPALMAIQPAPFGSGWTVAQLAENCGVLEDEMRAFLDHVSPMGNAMWQPRARTRIAGRRRRRPASCARPSRARAA